MMNYKHSAYIWKLKAKLQRYELRVARAGFDVSLITVTALGRALENQAAKIAELEATVRGLRNVKRYVCPWCDGYDPRANGDYVNITHALDCPWLTSGKLVGE